MRRFVQTLSAETLPADFGADITATLEALPDRYNIGVRDTAAIVLDHGDGIGTLEAAWGLIPAWSKLPETKYTTVTARLQRAPRSRIFRKPWESRRCVVPMSGYYKWDRTHTPPVPYFIQPQDGQALLAAGLWEVWEKGDAPLRSFAVLTHPNPAIPAPLVADGPIFLRADRWRDWIGGPWFPMRFLTGMPQPVLHAYPVSRAIRDRARDDYTLLEPVDPRDEERIAETDDAMDEDEDEDGD